MSFLVGSGFGLGGCSGSPIEDWPVGVTYRAESLVLEGDEVPAELASTFEIQQYADGEAWFRAFGCGYGSGPLIIDGRRFVGVDLLGPGELDECEIIDDELFSLLRTELFFNGTATVKFEDDELVFESEGYRAVLVADG